MSISIIHLEDLEIATRWTWAKISFFTWPPCMYTQVILLGSREGDYRENLEILSGKGLSLTWIPI